MADISKEQIKNLDIKPPNKSAFSIETDLNFPKLHTLCLASGKRGGGKSVAVANFLKIAYDKGYYDKIFLITPTYESNRSIWDICYIEEENVFEPTKTVLANIKELLKAEREEWDAFLYKKEEYENFISDIRKKTIDIIDDDTLLKYLTKGYLEMGYKKPQWKYRKEVMPRLAVICDDSIGSDLLLPSAGLTKFVISHRHHAKGMGISVFMLVQSYCGIGNNGVARGIREQITLLLLFKCRDEAMRKKIHSEIGSDIDLDKFDKFFDYATQEDFGFLMIDFAPKNKERVFRKNFNEYLF
jgi:hypothetical protein